MRVHNLVKDLVIQRTKEICDQEAQENKTPPLGDLCQMDVVCFVLNRVAPEYVVSGRGVAYSEQDYQGKIQKMADMTRLIKEGIKKVTQNQRNRSEASPVVDPGYYFNFPSIIGRLFNGFNFTPLSDVDVSLKYSGVLVGVLDPNWQNPYTINRNTAGTFLFWPHPIKAEQPQLEKKFEFEIQVKAEGYEDLHYFFEITSQSGNFFKDFVMTTESYRLKDLYLFPSSPSS